MFATFAGGYSRKPLPAQPDRLGQAEADLRAGHIDEAAYRVVADGFVQEVLDEMAIVTLGIVGDGGVRAADRALPWIRGLAGLQAGERVALPGGEVVTRPVVSGDVRWHDAVLVDDDSSFAATKSLHVGAGDGLAATGHYGLEFAFHTSSRRTPGRRGTA